ncbi:DEAD/DEAH box helicase [Buchananella felis]|uniref:DEAD/DEAH box helicase n=1 Tax=Buchananella felis TaxID=3231492 RepID=UPI0035289BFB
MSNENPRDEFALTETDAGLVLTEGELDDAAAGAAFDGGEFEDGAFEDGAEEFGSEDYEDEDFDRADFGGDAEGLEADDYEGDAEGEDTEEGDDADASDEPTGPTFADLGLPTELLDAITEMGFVHPTPIQAQAIPPLLAGRDVVGVAQTGTGKTAAFGLPLLADLTGAKAVEAIVLAPTRELAMQTADALEDFSASLHKARVLAVYGGSSYEPQLRGLRAGANVVVGTPGRVIDLIERGALNLDSVKFLVLDEADEMLRMGFAEDVETIASGIPAGRRTALFSATMPPAIKQIADTHLSNPVRVEVARQSSTVSTVEQEYAVVPFRHKVGALSRVLATSSARAAIVFVRTKSAAEEVALELGTRGITAAAISGDVPQRERERIVERLREGTLSVLVATDVAARGLDVERLDLVVNFDVPREAEAYVHRIGRTGRAGREGRALTFLTPKEKSRLRQIERLTGSELTEIALPTPRDVSLHRAATLLGRLRERAAKGRLDIYREAIADLLAGTLSSGVLGDDVAADVPAEAGPAAQGPLELADVAAALLALAIGDEGPERVERGEGKRRVRKEEEVDEDGEFIGARFEPGREPARPSRSAAERGGRRSRLTTRYRVEVGHKDKAAPGAIVGAITGETGLSGSDVGKIDIFPSFSLVEISADLSPEARRRLHKAVVAGRQLRLREDDGPRGGGRFGRAGRFERDGQERSERREGGERFETERPGRFAREDRDGERREGGERFETERPGRGDFKRGGERGSRFSREEGGFEGGKRGGRFERDGQERSSERAGRFERGSRDFERGGRFERDFKRGGEREERGFEGRKVRSFERSFEHGARRGHSTRGGFDGPKRGFEGPKRSFGRQERSGWEPREGRSGWESRGEGGRGFGGRDQRGFPGGRGKKRDY